MPTKELDNIRNSTIVPEYRKVKIGEKKPNRPDKYKNPVVTFAVKPAAGSNFATDELNMSRIRAHLGLKPGTPITGVPVRLLSDNVHEILYVYRSIYNKMRRAMCKSDLGHPKAKRWFTDKPVDDSKGAKQGKYTILYEPYEVDCDEKCPYWGKNGEKTDCSWHAVLTMQLENDPVFPSPTRFRTSGWNTMMNLMGSLNKIASVTGGVLANIPLLLVEDEVDGFVKREGKHMKYPVMSFQFRGTIGELREAAIRELDSRRRLVSAMSGKDVGVIAIQPNQLTAGKITDALPDDDGIDQDEYLDMEDGDSSEVEAPVKTAAEEMAAVEPMLKDIENLAAKLQMSERGLSALYDKHSGVAKLVLDELTRMVKPKVPEEKPAPKEEVVDDTVDEMWGPGDDSGEPSETMATETKTEKKTAQPPPEVKKGDSYDDFNPFDDEE